MRIGFLGRGEKDFNRGMLKGQTCPKRDFYAVFDFSK
jgi:hypothetical protein